MPGTVRIIIFYLISILLRIFLKRKIKVSLGWIRIEPATELYKVALEQGVIASDQSLLQSDSENIKKSFYLNQSLDRTDKFMLQFLRFSDGLKKKIKKILKRGDKH